MSVRIIKQGNIENATYRFTCLNCDCIFEANGTDVATEFARNASGHSGVRRHLAKCPCCGSFAAFVEKVSNDEF